MLNRPCALGRRSRRRSPASPFSSIVYAGLSCPSDHSDHANSFSSLDSTQCCTVTIAAIVRADASVSRADDRLNASGTRPAIASRLARDRECIQRAKTLWSTEEVEENSFDLTLSGAELALHHLKIPPTTRDSIPNKATTSDAKGLCHMRHRTSWSYARKQRAPPPQAVRCCPSLPVGPMTAPPPLRPETSILGLLPVIAEQC